MPTLEDVLNDWYYRAKISQEAHYLSSTSYVRKSYSFGILVIALTTVVGTSVFATLQKQQGLWIQISVGLASVLAAVLASLQTFLGYPERAEKHRVAGAKYGALGRELEVLRTSTKVESEEVIADLRKRLDALSLDSPNNTIRIYRKAEAKIKDELARDKKTA